MAIGVSAFRIRDEAILGNNAEAHNYDWDPAVPHASCHLSSLDYEREARQPGSEMSGSSTFSCLPRRLRSVIPAVYVLFPVGSAVFGRSRGDYKGDFTNVTDSGLGYEEYMKALNIPLNLASKGNSRISVSLSSP